MTTVNGFKLTGVKFGDQLKTVALCPKPETNSPVPAFSGPAFYASLYDTALHGTVLVK